MKIYLSAALIVFIAYSGYVFSSPAEQAQEIFKTQPKIVNTNYKSAIPIEVWRNKIFLAASVNGKRYRFILDTGSPTILTKKVAEALQLEIKGENTGKDANGNLVKMDLAVLDELRIGNVEFRNIPVFIFDPSNLALGEEILDGGVIGSEIMPLSNWQINFDKKELVLTDDTSKLEYIDKAFRAKLQVYGYPYMPILEHEINGKFKDNALLDTGSAELLHLNQNAFEELQKRKLIKSVITTAYGTFGQSAGGRGEDTHFSLLPLKSLAIGELKLKNLEVWTRPDAPSLVGAGIFESHIVTLDYSTRVVHFYKYAEPKASRRTFGFKPYFENGAMYVGFLVKDSPAAKAGLQLHDKIIKVNDLDFHALEKADLSDVYEQLSTLDKLAEIKLVFKSGDQEKQVTLRK